MDPITRTTDTNTSHEASDRIQPVLSKLQGIVLDLFREEADFFNDGLTDTELIDLFVSTGKFDPDWPQVRPETVRKRRSDLTGYGVLRASDRTRPNLYNFNETVWTLA